MSQKKADILSNIITYVPSRYFSQFLGFFTSLFMKRFLGPLSAGIWDLIKLIISYVDYAELGSTLTIYYKVPVLVGQGKREEADKIKNIVFAFIMLTSFIASIGVLTYALIFSRKLTPQLFWGLISASLLIILERIYTFYLVAMRAFKDYGALSKSVCFDAVINLLLVLIIVSRFKLYGLYAAIILLTILNILYIRRNVNYHLAPLLDWKATLAYIKFGFPLYLTSILTVLFNSIDRLMIAGFLGFQQLGFYSIAMMSKNYSHQLSTNFSHVTSPHFMEDFGKFGDSERIYKYIIKGTLTLSCFMSVVLGLIFIYSKPVIQLTLPSFLPGLTSLRIFIFISFLSSLMVFPTNYIVTQGKQNKLIIFSVISLAMNVILNYLFIKTGYGINGVALASAIATLFYFLAIIIYAMKHFAAYRRIGNYLLRIFLPPLYAVSLIAALQAVRYGGLWITPVIRSVLFLLACILLAALVEKEAGLVSTFLDIIKKRFIKDEK